MTGNESKSLDALVAEIDEHIGLTERQLATARAQMAKMGIDDTMLSVANSTVLEGQALLQQLREARQLLVTQFGH
jgi:hypothetical protein